ncbi:FAD-dependent oxidoreductase [Nitratifractor salsuginis]|uniref:FAD-dependent pyridine nucleotide-disulfide oxidoreductase n=1 Tax=Nitratifractor salsuginis (strain DSM 16511 / JCM 12458 / E9I37-1) TaxID=749222 RepID=E6X161_NITSE|nr:FAD-dependent oxidoreductase [Nitratifractor salsuginis]ADV45864.1 FAD-dependent pyridine nucleotide-disulfide oxidoreductase [Nitratifractor salsuginis DSM 16511]
MKSKIVIAGGGVAGVSAALLLGSLGMEVTLLERQATLVLGPPFCHLHAGGNLYREISDAQCRTLLRQSIDFAKLYPFVVDRRPTVIAVPTEDAGTPEALLPRLELLREDYAALVAQDSANEVLGAPEGYYRLFGRQELKKLAEMEPVEKPSSPEEWMIPVARHLDFDRVKFPLILVQEYGLNLFRLAAGAGLTLEAMERVTIHRSTRLVDVEPSGEGWRLRCEGAFTGELEADYLINAAGFRTGEIDDMLGLREKRMVEFKAAYTSRWKDREARWPEVIFHGERGTPQGMGQFTPYPAGYVQLHGMTERITLYPDGLVASTETSSQPRLPEHLLRKIEKGWPEDELQERTRRAIKHLARFLPDFAQAEVGSPPLFGAQQIPGEDPTLRVAEVAFPLPRYARCEIVKVSSVTDMAREILRDLERQGLAEGLPDESALWQIPQLHAIEEAALAQRARRIAQSRGYPAEMGERCIE